MSNAFVSFRDVKALVGIEALLTHYGLTPTLSRKGESLVGPCPFCASQAPAFTASLAKNAWYCFAECKGGGNVLDFVMRREGVRLRDAASLLDRWFVLGLGSAVTTVGGDRPKAKPSEPVAPSKPASRPNEPLSFALKHLDPTHPGFASYGLTEATAKAFEAGFCAKGLQRGRLAVPVKNAKGELVAYVGIAPERDDPERYKFPPTFAADREIFNLPALQGASSSPETVFLAAELVDALFLAEQGLQRVLALFDGTLSSHQEALLRGVLPEGSLLVAVSADDRLTALVPRLAGHVAVRLLGFDAAIAKYGPALNVGS